MPDEGQPERQWIVEPPGPGEISLHMALGEGVELTEEQESAVRALVNSLESRDPEVTGHAIAECLRLHQCGAFTLCPKEAAAADHWNIMGTFGTRPQ